MDSDAAALAAAAVAGVTVRELADAGEVREVYGLFDRIWRPEPHSQPITAALIRALSKANNYVVGAYAGGELVGACVAFFGPPAQATMHSHITGAVRPGVGFALKTHQRDWAMRNGLKTISWTYDPLVSRNAYFNLGKLAATADEYLTNFYGGMNDGRNGADDSDRVLVTWDLTAPAVDAACAGWPATDEPDAAAVVALDRTADGRPVTGDIGGRTVLVAVPPDIETLRGAEPGVAHAWRIAVRETLGTLMAARWRVVGFDRAGWYVLTRDGDS